MVIRRLTAARASDRLGVGVAIGVGAMLTLMALVAVVVIVVLYVRGGRLPCAGVCVGEGRGGGGS